MPAIIRTFSATSALVLQAICASAVLGADYGNGGAVDGAFVVLNAVATEALMKVCGQRALVAELTLRARKAW